MAEIPHTPADTEKCKPCLLCGMFGARSSSGTDHNISRKECVTVVDAWGTYGARERCLEWWYRAECGVIPTPVPVEKLRLNWIIWISLEPRSTTPATTLRKQIPFYIAQAPIFCLCRVLLLTFRVIRAPCRSRAGPPSNLGVALSADALTFEYERHRACLSVKTSTDEPSHVPLHACILRGAALSS